jgi:hypothetical protein
MNDPVTPEGGGEKLDRSKAPSTDMMLDTYDHISDGTVRRDEFFAGHGLNVARVTRALAAMVPSGEGRMDAAMAGMILGLQLGAMRLPPVESTRSEDEPPCNCFFCLVQRAAEGAPDEDG